MNQHVPQTKRMQVFMNGRSRAVRIPKEFDFEGNEVELLKQENGEIIIRPIGNAKGLLELLATMQPLDEKDWLPEIDDLPVRPFTAFDDYKE
jgi:antitoxin VapB